MNIGQHSIVNEYVFMGEGSKIWHYCNIYGTKDMPVIIGVNTQIGSYTEIKPGVRIGHYCRLQSHIFIPEGVSIKNNVFIGPRVTFTNDKYPNIVDTLKKTWNLEGITVEEYASIGANATINPGIVIGRSAIIGSSANVTKSIPEGCIAIGNPARVIGNIYDEKFRRKYARLIDSQRK